MIYFVCSVASLIRMLRAFRQLHSLRSALSKQLGSGLCRNKALLPAAAATGALRFFGRSMSSGVEASRDGFFKMGKSRSLLMQEEGGGPAPEGPLAKQLFYQIKYGGAMTMAEYMSACLCDPSYGFYTSQTDVLGAKGHFTTAPELTSMFGELMGIWCVDALQSLKAGQETVQLVELGPGKGSLMHNLLRIGTKFPEFKAVTVNLVEASPILRAKQRDTLGVRITYAGSSVDSNMGGQRRAQQGGGSDELQDINQELRRLGRAQRGEGEEGQEGGGGKEGLSDDVTQMAHELVEGVTPGGVTVRWLHSFQDVPEQGPLLLIANEFFDCLPVHQFRKTSKGLCEVMVDINQDDPADQDDSEDDSDVEAAAKTRNDSNDKGGEEEGGEEEGFFRLALSPGSTIAAEQYMTLHSQLQGYTDTLRRSAHLLGPAAGQGVVDPNTSRLHRPDAQPAPEPAARVITDTSLPISPPPTLTPSTTPAASPAAAAPTSGQASTSSGFTVSQQTQPTAAAGATAFLGSTAGATAASAAAGQAAMEEDKRKALQTVPDEIEVSPASWTLMERITRRLASQGGACLIVDYGQDGAQRRSLQGVKQHKYWDVLKDQGEVDLTALVDFAALRGSAESTIAGLQMAKSLTRDPMTAQLLRAGGSKGRKPAQAIKVVPTCHPLVTQRELLRELGLGARTEEALGAAETEGEQEQILACFQRLVGEEPEQMGTLFKAFCVSAFPDANAMPPVGFRG